jgi:hypothetical protein
MPKKSTRGDHSVFIQPETTTADSYAMVQPGQPDCLIVDHSDAGTTIYPAAEEDTVLFRPRLYCVPED